MPEDVVAEALHFGQSQIGFLIAAQHEMARDFGRKKWNAPLFGVPEEALEQLTVCVCVCVCVCVRVHVVYECVCVSVNVCVLLAEILSSVVVDVNAWCPAM